MKTRIATTVLAAALLGTITGGVALASPGSAEGPRTDVVGTFRLVEANGATTAFALATPEQGPDGDGFLLQPGERVEVIGTGSSCLDPATQQRHNADEGPLGGHQAECHVDREPAPVPASWARVAPAAYVTDPGNLTVPVDVAGSYRIVNSRGVPQAWHNIDRERIQVVAGDSVEVRVTAEPGWLGEFVPGSCTSSKDSVTVKGPWPWPMSGTCRT